MTRCRSSLARGIAPFLVALLGCSDILGIDDRTLVGEGGTPGGGGGAGAQGGGAGGLPTAGGGQTGGGGETAGGGGEGGESFDCPLLSCGGVCVNPFTDDAHCGYCDIACAEDQTCRNGLCDQRLRSSPGHEQCARVGGNAYCWGASFNGESGTGVVSTGPDGPLVALRVTLLDGLPTPRFLTQSGHSTCALLEDGSVRCFGDNSTGGLGIGSVGGPEDGEAGEGCCYVTEAVEPDLPDDAVFVDIAGGAAGWEPDFYVALTETGDVYCWGSQATTPVKKTTNAVQIVAGIGFACALDTAGHVECWGTPWGAGASNPVCDRPVETIETLTNVRLIGAGHHTAFAVSQSGTVFAWGDNRYATLGPGFVTNQSYWPPRAMEHEFGAPILQITGAHSGSCARLVGAEILCWGEHGHQGDGTGASVGSDPAPNHTLITGAMELAASTNDFSAIDARGELVSWSRFYSEIPVPMALSE